MLLLQFNNGIKDTGLAGNVSILLEYCHHCISVVVGYRPNNGRAFWRIQTLLWDPGDAGILLQSQVMWDSTNCQ